MLKIFVRHLGDHVSECVARVFDTAGQAGDLIYNANFRGLIGGPRWIDAAKPGRACFRKYIGLRGGGDFMLATSHPVALLDSDAVVHSHSDPRWHADERGFAGYAFHASVRNPAGIVSSACFSLNALASEYIQRFIAREDDNDLIRQELALYKLSDSRFFDGIVKHYVEFFSRFMPMRQSYAIMRWEDLIQSPTETIRAVASAAGTPINEQFAAEIWQRLDHRNLTGAHMHNFRAGKGIVGDWRQWLTNSHLDRMRDAGLERVAIDLGYEPFGRLNEDTYTPFQARLEKLVRDAEIHTPAVDIDLFGYAFNKSNIDASAFGFRTRAWRAETRIERSTFKDEALETAAQDAAEAAAARLNRLFEDVLVGSYGTEREGMATLDRLATNHAKPLRGHLPKRFDAAFAEARNLVASRFAGDGNHRPTPERPPLLLYSVGSYNIVAYRGIFLGIPQSLGPIDLTGYDFGLLEGAIISQELAEVDRSVRDAQRQVLQ